MADTRLAGRRRRPQAFRYGLVVALVCTAAALIGYLVRPRAASVWDATPCVAGVSISGMEAFGQVVGREFSCALLYDDSSVSWPDWEDPWILRGNYAQNQWVSWLTVPDTTRTAIVDVNLFPSSVRPSVAIPAGAAGVYEKYARVLAANLVAKGLGSVVIRLGHEANGTWYPDDVPRSAQGEAEWVRFWDNTVTAMRSVSGAHFLFDWTVASGFAAPKDMPFTSFYPGNDYVDIIGADVYDSSKVTGPGRWQAEYSEPLGLGAVVQFAKAHGKPLSIGEWGIGPAEMTSSEFAGDDPAFVNGIASVVRNNDVAYQAAFLDLQEGGQLMASPHSLAAYRADFGADGTAVGSRYRGTQQITPSPAPPLAITAGPANDSTVSQTTVTFSFNTPTGNTVGCNLDGNWHRCSSYGTDTARSLSAGYHWWEVEVYDDVNHYTRLIERSFDVT